MGDEYEKQRHEDRVIATLYRLDPDRLAAVRRAATGMTRCPACDTLNPADQKRCYKCDANLYYDLPDEEKPKTEGQEGDAEKEKEEESEPEDDSHTPPYY